EPAADRLPAAQAHVRRLHHRVGRLDRADLAASLDHAERQPGAWFRQEFPLLRDVERGAWSAGFYQSVPARGKRAGARGPDKSSPARKGALRGARRNLETPPAGPRPLRNGPVAEPAARRSRMALARTLAVLWLLLLLSHGAAVLVHEALGHGV